SFEAFHKRAGVEDEQSQELNRAPWQESDPLKMLEGKRVAKAFRINATLAALRQPGAPRRPVGVERCSWGEVYASDGLPTLETSRVQEPPWRRDAKIVDPSLEVSQEGIYRSLRQAVEDARAEDVILIKHTG